MLAAGEISVDVFDDEVFVLLILLHKDFFCYNFSAFLLQLHNTFCYGVSGEASSEVRVDVYGGVDFFSTIAQVYCYESPARSPAKFSGEISLFSSFPE